MCLYLSIFTLAKTIENCKFLSLFLPNTKQSFNVVFIRFAQENVQALQMYAVSWGVKSTFEITQISVQSPITSIYSIGVSFVICSKIPHVCISLVKRPAADVSQALYCSL